MITNADYEGAPRGRKVVLADCERQMLIGSRDALYSAFENVIRNALAYTQDGTTVTVRLVRDPRDAKNALIVVRDHGPGVPAGELARIFEPFYRTDAARTRASGGTGLGLAIARARSNGTAARSSRAMPKTAASRYRSGCRRASIRSPRNAPELPQAST